MTQKNIHQKILAILLNMGIAEKAVTEKASFIRDLGLDSLDFAELVMELEMAFGLEIPILEAENIQNIYQAVSYIGDRVNIERG